MTIQAKLHNFYKRESFGEIVSGERQVASLLVFEPLVWAFWFLSPWFWARCFQE